jgi:hypothetical protein
METLTKHPTFVALLLAAPLAFATACMPTEFHGNPIANAAKDQTPVNPTPRPGQPTVTKTDSFTQDESANKVDVLIIDDNSYSMEVEQKKMSDRFPSFVSALGDLDYHIAVTTTDIDSASPKLNLGGRVMDWAGTTSKTLSPQTPNPSAVFRNTIRRSETIGCAPRGDCPSGNEQPLKATILAMEQRLKENAGVFRDNVDLAVVVLSDEDEMSDGPPNATKPHEVIDAFKAQFGDSKRLRVFGIVVQSGDKACYDMQLAQTQGGNGASFATHVEELAKLTGGSTNSICDQDYSKSLSDISKSVRRLVGTFELSGRPVPGSLKVTLTPAPAKAIAHHVEGKNLIFDNPPSAGTKIDVSYEVAQ